jgi:D-isomer specific 2-hydroxyacid dehydrogenase, NAD binding domain
VSSSAGPARAEDAQVDQADVRRAALEGLVGTALEQYDVVIHGTAAAIVFDRGSFPDVSPAVGVIASRGAYAVGSDEAALVAALEDGRIAGAALDVTAMEQLPADSPLRDGPHLLLTPHAAGAEGLVAHDVTALLAGGEFTSVVER